jgi:hypothetical protein
MSQNLLVYLGAVPDHLSFLTPSSIPHRQPQLTTQVSSFISTFFAPYRQPIFVLAFFVKLALRLPLFASAALLLFHSVNNPVAQLIYRVFPHAFSLSLVVVVGIFMCALLAPTAQLIFAATFYAELAPVFPLMALGALLHVSGFGRRFHL